MKPDPRSEEAQQYRRLYKTALWQQTRAHQLAAHPICQRCKPKGRIVRATVCHHVDKDSKASVETFYAGPFESVCSPCHDRDIQSEERLGFSKAIGTDGWPTDERHPANAVR